MYVLMNAICLSCRSDVCVNLIFLQSLTGLEKLWERSLEESGTALRLNMGILCLNTVLSCYLSLAPHHIQMELTTVDLIPLLKERGVELCWGLKNSFLLCMPSLLSAVNDGGKNPATNIATPENVDPNIKSPEPMKGWSERHLCHMLPEAQVDTWLSLPEAFSSPSFLLFAGLVHDSWNKWPLLYDPQKYARKWIASLKEGMICIDARDG